jgi:hypothetical protein
MIANAPLAQSWITN